MPRTADVVTRHLTGEERELRQAYVAAHPGQPEPMPTTAGWAPVADWLASLEVPEAKAAAAVTPAKVTLTGRAG